MLGYLCVDILCSEKQTVFRERRKTVSFEEQIMSKDIFTPNGDCLVYYLSNLLRNARSFGGYLTIIP